MEVLGLSIVFGRFMCRKEVGISCSCSCFGMMVVNVVENYQGIELKKLLENRNDQEEIEENIDDSFFLSEDEIFN